MHPALVTHQLCLQALRDLVDGVRGYLDINRPRFDAPGVAKRLKAGIRMVEAYLRRLLLVLALELEPTLVDRRGPQQRPKDKFTLNRPPPFGTFTFSEMPADIREELHHKDQIKRCKYREKRPPGRAFMVKLYRRIDLLASIAADPMKRATRLAYHLARNREGLFMPPGRLFKPAGPVKKLWNLEASVTFSAMGHFIWSRSRERPPPLPERRKWGPSIRSIDPIKNYPWPAWLPGAQRRGILG